MFIKFVEDEESCQSPDHDLPSPHGLPPGNHVWICPKCAKATGLTVLSKQAVSDMAERLSI